jgi:hypothetical protein
VTPRPDPLGREDGLTLVELLISVFVGAVVLSLVATILATTLQANAATRDRDLATGRAQAISTSLTTSVRNAARVTVQPLAGGGSVARAQVAVGASGWECRAWAVVDLETWDAAGRRAGSDGRFELRTHTSAPLSGTATAPAPAIAWGALTEHVEPATGPTGTAKPYFAWTDPSLSWNLEVVASEQPQLNARSVVPAAGSAVALAHQGGTGVRCW